MIISVKIAKLGSVVDFDVESLPPTSVHYALTYGLTQSVNDAAASVVAKDFDDTEAFRAAVVAKTNKRLDQIRDGNTPGSRAPADPNAAVARKLAKSLTDAGLTPDEALAAIEAFAAKKAKKAA